MSMTLLDWRRRMTAKYAEVRATHDEDPAWTLARFRSVKEPLFRQQPDTPIAAQHLDALGGLS